MKKFMQAMSYRFNRNLGWQDRALRAAIGVGIIAAYMMGRLPGVLGIVLVVIAAMVIATAVVARCSICYMTGACTIGANERTSLDAKGIQYEQ